MASRCSPPVSAIDGFERDHVDQIASDDAIGRPAGPSEFNDVNAVAGEKGQLRVAHLVNQTVRQVNSEGRKGVLTEYLS